MMPFDMEDLIRRWEKQDIGQDDTALLYRFVYKAETSKTLKTHYNDDFKESTAATPVTSDFIDRLLTILMDRALEKQDLRLINSALKLAQNGLISPAYRAGADIAQKLDDTLSKIDMHAHN